MYTSCLMASVLLTVQSSALATSQPLTNGHMVESLGPAKVADEQQLQAEEMTGTLNGMNERLANEVRQRVEAEACMRQTQQALQEAQAGVTPKVREVEAIKKEALKVGKESKGRTIAAKAAVAADQQSRTSRPPPAKKRTEQVQNEETC